MTAPTLLAVTCALLLGSSGAARAAEASVAVSTDAAPAGASGSAAASTEATATEATATDASSSAVADAASDSAPTDSPPPPPGPSAQQPPPRQRFPASASPLSRRGYADERRRDAREGLIFSFGVGGAQTYLSGVGHQGAGVGDLRLGYGFSDRFQLFFDFSGMPTDYPNGYSTTSWTTTLRGQTVLIGDRRGNGLNLNAGIGLGGLDTNDGYSYGYGYGDGYGYRRNRVGLALAGGLSVDLRLTPSFALSPEFIAQWHQVPNNYGQADDIHWALGGQLNFVWYIQ